jgi:hypothetical protein
MFYNHIALLADFGFLASGRVVLGGGVRPVTSLEYRAAAPAIDLERLDF